MADNDEKIVYKLDLDADTFMKTLNQVNDRLGTLEKTAKVASPVLYFELAEKAVDAFKIAVELAGKAMDMVFEGENIRAINYQFEVLTKNAGIATDTLREGLEKAGKGLVDDTDLIEIANKALVTMGSSAAKLPEILELSRKATSAFGGDLKTNFETFTQAVSTGNTRMLKQFGIVVDTEKAVREYAKSLGVTVGALSETERKQAIANAAIEQGRKKYKDVQTDLRETTDSWTRLKNSVNDAKENIDVFLAKTIGPSFKSAFNSAAEVIANLTGRFKMVFGTDEATKAAGTIKVYEDRLASLQERLKANEAQNTAGASWMLKEGLAKEKQKILSEMDSVQGVLDLQRENLQKAKGKDGPTAGGDDSAANNEKRLLSQTKFDQDLLTLRKQTVQQQLEVETSSLENERLIKEQYDLAYQEMQLRQREVDDQYKKGDIATLEQAEQLKLQIRQQYDSQTRQLYMEQEQQRLKAYDNEVKMADTAGKGIGAGFAQGSARATAEMNDFGKQGQRMFTNVTSHSKNAFIEMGKGQKAASDIAKGFVFGMLADEAEARGTLILASSIFPPNPLGIAAGGGLLALSGALRSMGGGESGGIGVSGGGGAGGGGVNAELSATPNQQQIAPPKKSVTIQVQGSYFETEQTKQRLMEMIRDQTDATDFAYKQIGSP